MNIELPKYEFSKLSQNVHYQLMESLNYFSEVLKENKIFEDTSKKNMSWMSYYFYNQCLYHLKNGDADQARHYFKKIIEVTKKPSLESFRCMNSTSLNQDERKAIYTWVEKSEKGHIDINDLSHSVKCQDAVDKIKAAKTILKRYLPDYFLEYQTFCNEIILIAKGDKNFLESGSTFELYGLSLICYREDKSIFSYVESIVHEVAHLVLFAYTTQYKMVLNKPNELYEGPFRKDLRPMGGNFHAMFVLSRLIDMYRKLEEHFPDEQELKDRKAVLLERWGYIKEIIQSKAELSSQGLTLFEACCNTVGQN